ncbi:MAG: NAD(P)/FAD-dependent oxidoreductase [Aestuariivirga sp.]
MSSYRIAVIGSGISGLSAAWLLSQRHEVTLFEAEDRLGGHSHTIDVPSGDGSLAVDTGFMVYNEATYPNLAALFDYLDVETKPTEMSLSISCGGNTYGAAGLSSFFDGGRLVFRPRQWRLLADILRFFRNGGRRANDLPPRLTLGEFLDREGYSRDFAERHLLPMAGAIWSSRSSDLRDYPARALLNFFANHGLLQMFNRPTWRTVCGGSWSYVEKLVEDGKFRHFTGHPVKNVRRFADRVTVETATAATGTFDHVVLAAQARQNLSMLSDADEFETGLLSSFHMSENPTIVHRDPSFMPKRRSLWSSWNCYEANGVSSVTYWMNRLQSLAGKDNIFVTLNPQKAAAPGTLIRSMMYRHPLFSPGSLAAQEKLWNLQGRRRTWFCGAWFGSGFHEDGLQAGLAVAEQLGGAQRPWNVASPSGRIHVGPAPQLLPDLAEAAE